MKIGVMGVIALFCVVVSFAIQDLHPNKQDPVEPLSDTDRHFMYVCLVHQDYYTCQENISAIKKIGQMPDMVTH